jgi:hypothetical protein
LIDWVGWVQTSRTKKNQKIAETGLGLGLSPAGSIFLDQKFVLQNTLLYIIFFIPFYFVLISSQIDFFGYQKIPEKIRNLF